MYEVLEELGFSKLEQKVYAAALKLGVAPVLEISKEAKLNRVTVHSILERFEHLGLVRSIYEGKRRRIAIESPAELSRMLDEERALLERKQNVLGKAMIDLMDEFRSTQRGLQVRTFQGAKGFEQMATDALSAQTELLEFANIDNLYSVIGEFIEEGYLPVKYTRKVETKFLFVETPFAHEYIQKRYMDPPEAAPMEARFVDHSSFPIDSFFAIYDEKLSILSPSTQDGIIIEDSQVVAALRPFFYFVWNATPSTYRNRPSSAAE
ncbi:helix-turn-helix domain-containing protein [bacterium]|nr:helix-turn-helix domain-containing protein [bacterium]